MSTEERTGAREIVFGTTNDGMFEEYLLKLLEGMFVSPVGAAEFTVDDIVSDMKSIREIIISGAKKDAALPDLPADVRSGAVLIHTVTAKLTFREFMQSMFMGDINKVEYAIWYVATLASLHKVSSGEGDMIGRLCKIPLRVSYLYGISKGTSHIPGKDHAVSELTTIRLFLFTYEYIHKFKNIFLNSTETDNSAAVKYLGQSLVTLENSILVLGKEYYEAARLVQQ